MRRNALTLPVKHWREFLGLPGQWCAPLAWLAIAWLALGIGFFRDWATIADQAWSVSTYNHILLIPAILGWMVIQRCDQLARLEPQPWWPALGLIAGAAFVWLLGAFSGLDTARQLGAVALLVLTVPLLLGVRVSAALLFPLAYAFLLVPFGDELIPSLQMITAAITVALTDFSGIPAVINGVFINTPAGLFEVAEACSGVKFLIAMIAFGLLVGNVCFLSWKRRIGFFALCVVVPILANGVRAWATILAAQYIGAEAATSFDHIVYGWVFFGVVIVLVTAAGWRYFDRPVDTPMVDAEAIRRSPLLKRLSAFRTGALHALLALAAILAGAQLWAHRADRLEAPLWAEVSLPGVPGWRRVAYAPQVAWRPLATGARHKLIGRYRDADQHEVDVFVAIYAGQGEGREAGGFGQGALMPDGRWSWLAPGPPIAGARSDRMLAEGRVERLALTWYRTGALFTGSNMRLKLNNMADRLTLTARPTTMLIVSAEETERHSAEDSVRRFITAAGPLDAWMDRVAGMK